MFSDIDVKIKERAKTYPYANELALSFIVINNRDGMITVLDLDLHAHIRQHVFYTYLLGENRQINDNSNIVQAQELRAYYKHPLPDDIDRLLKLRNDVEIELAQKDMMKLLFKADNRDCSWFQDIEDQIRKRAKSICYEHELAQSWFVLINE